MTIEAPMGVKHEAVLLEDRPLDQFPLRRQFTPALGYLRWPFDKLIIAIIVVVVFSGEWIMNMMRMTV